MLAVVLYAAAFSVVAIALVAHRIFQVRKVRYANYDAMMAKYSYLLDDMSKMTYFEAEEISKYSSFIVSHVAATEARGWWQHRTAMSCRVAECVECVAPDWSVTDLHH